MSRKQLLLVAGLECPHAHVSALGLTSVRNSLPVWWSGWVSVTNVVVKMGQRCVLWPSIDPEPCLCPVYQFASEHDTWTIVVCLMLAQRL